MEPFEQKASRELQNCKAEIEQLASSAIDAMKTVRSFRAEAQELKRYEEALARKLKVQKQKGICSAVFLLLRRVRHPTQIAVYSQYGVLSSL